MPNNQEPVSQNNFGKTSFTFNFIDIFETKIQNCLKLNYLSTESDGLMNIFKTN